jgi:hypothetical protein
MFVCAGRLLLFQQTISGSRAESGRRMDRLMVDRSALRIAADIRGSKSVAFLVKNSFEKGWAVLLVYFWLNSSFFAWGEKRMERGLFIGG